MKGKSCSALAALEILHERILTVGPSCGPDNQQETHKQDFLAQMLRDEAWAKTGLDDRLTSNSDFERK